MTVLYGSSVADTTLTTACKMAAASGGTETSKQTTFGGSANFGEVWSKGNANATTVTSIPATPTGNGWVFQPGAGTFSAGNWSATGTFAKFGGSSPWSLRFYKYTAGSYTLIGTLTATPTTSAKSLYTFSAVSMAAVVFGASDLLYIDLWFQDSTGAGGDSATAYVSTSATAGVVNDLQVTTSTWTPASSGNTIVGRARATYAESIASKGLERARFLLSIAQTAPARDTFKLSIGSNQASRSKFTVSMAVKGRSLSLFTESLRESGRGRSRFYSASVSKGQARSRFYSAAVSKAQARARFTGAITQKASTRVRFLLSIGHKAASRAKYLISKASKGLARAKFAEAVAQRGQARSRFSLSASIRGLAESTFKIALGAGHVITGYMRSRYTTAIRQSQAQRSKYLIRFFQTGIARSLFKAAAKTTTQARSRFLVRFGITGRARSRYLLSIRQSALARSHFVMRLVLLVRARSKFLVQGILVTYPIKSITHAVSQVLSAAWNVLSALGLVVSHAPALTISHQELAMPAPYTTILPTITVTDISGALVSNASAVSLIAYFPDGTSSSYSLTSGITNLGAGQYQAKYNTKGPGEIREVWSIIGADGTTLASAQFLIGVEY